MNHCYIVVVSLLSTHRNVISAWSSGTGAAGVTGALTYAALTYIHYTPEATLLLMLIVPFIQFLTFCIMLEEPNEIWATLPNPATSLIDHDIIQPDSVAPLNLTQKLDYFPKMLRYVLPLFAVYFCEYFINQGLVSLIEIFVIAPSKYSCEFFFTLLHVPNHKIKNESYIKHCT